jgi:hypothetical protein
VTDRWGKPIAGVTIAVTGSAVQIVSGSGGSFTIPVQSGAVKVRAGKPGFVKKTMPLAPPEAGATPAKLSFALYPDPESPGFYAVGSSTYATVAAKPVKTMGTEIRAFTGMSDVGEVRFGAKVDEFMFSSTLRRSELKRLGLQLHKLKFVEHEEVPGVLGQTQVTLNLWIADEGVAFDLTGLETDDDYILKVREPLSSGVYAFHTQGMLTSKDTAALDKLPDEMRIAFPFEVR